MTTHRLGAIELIELGSPIPSINLGRRPFMSGRYPHASVGRGPELGLEFLTSIGSFLTGAFEFIFRTLADIVNVPLDIASQGIGVLFDGVAGFLKNVPILGPICAELLLVGKAVIQWGLKVPGLLLGGIANIFGEIKNAIDATKSPADKKADADIGKENLLRKAEEKGGPALRSAVQSAISGKDPEGVTGIPPKNTNLPPGADDIGGGSDLDQILGIGLPVAGAAALALVLVS
jgi:hypothetical protein